jgi:hypothetical protein
MKIVTIAYLNFIFRIMKFVTVHTQLSICKMKGRRCPSILGQQKVSICPYPPLSLSAWICTLLKNTQKEQTHKKPIASQLGKVALCFGNEF